MEKTKLVDGIPTESDPFTVQEIKYAKNLADVIERVYGERHSLKDLINDYRQDQQKAHGLYLKETGF